ncbi:MAG: caspase family protein [Coleofasciculus sp. B1-GNL1-01]|uniref:caspase family protein n=1 Tax=Coleofasciculus sp. B1-GNL1-01 TaxID=3068484 RepID=UPI0032FBFECC
MKIALLIGVSEYGYGFHPVPGAVNAVEAMQRVLQYSFDEIETLINPNPPVMRETLETLLSKRGEEDVVLLFFSGQCIQDYHDTVYLGTSITATRMSDEHSQKELVKATVVPACLIQDILSNSPCPQNIVIIDGYCSNILDWEITANDYNEGGIKQQLTGEKWAFLSCFSSIPYFNQSKSSQPSDYTRYLIEGLATGLADRNHDDWICVKELHDYVSQQLKIVAPALKPRLYASEPYQAIALSQVPLNRLTLKYRKEAQRWIRGGEISVGGRSALDTLAQSLHLTPADCAAIEAQVLTPYREYQEKLQRYKQAFREVFRADNSLNPKSRKLLKDLQQSLGLRDQDIKDTEEIILSQKQSRLASQPNLDSDSDMERRGGTDIRDSLSRRSVSLIRDQRDQEETSDASTPREMLPQSGDNVPPTQSVEPTAPPVSASKPGEVSPEAEDSVSANQPLDSSAPPIPSSTPMEVSPQLEDTVPANQPLDPTAPPVYASTPPEVPSPQQESAIAPSSTFDSINPEPTQESTASNNNQPDRLSLKPNSIPEWYMQTPDEPETEPTSGVQVSSNLSNFLNPEPAVSKSSNKLLLWAGIGGGLATLALLISLFNRAAVQPSTDATDTVVSSPTTSPTATKSPNGATSSPSPSPSPSPEPKPSPEPATCSVIVTGNVRSDPASFRDNVITYLTREQVPITGKQTKGGWIEIKLPNQGLAWAHREVILDEEDIDSCMFEQGMTIELVPDIPPPPDFIYDDDED